MRLRSLRLVRYANFDDERIVFDPTPGVLNMILAPNGGGKSVVRSAFCDLLFGIHAQSPMGFRYGYPNMRIIAEAVTRENEPFIFGRRKGNGNTLIDAEGAVLDPATITRLLGRTDRSRLERLFALDTERLRQGEQDLLASDGDLGQALASGAGEVRNLTVVRQRLDDMRDGLAPRRKSSTRPFYVGLEHYVAARRDKDRSLLKPDDWVKLRKEHESARARQEEQNRIAKMASAEIAVLERVRRVRPLLATLDSSRQWLQANPDAPVLNHTLADRLAVAREQVTIFEEKDKREREEATRLQEQLAAFVVDKRLLNEAEEIDRLVTESGAARKSRADLPSVKASADAAETALLGFLRELGRDLSVERAREAVPPRATANQVRRLIQTYQSRKENEQAGPAAVRKRKRELDKAREELAALLAPDDISGLKALLEEIRGDGDPGRKATEVADQKALAKSNLETLMAKVPGWSGDTATLAALAPLSTETYEREAAALEQARAEVTRHLKSLREAESRRNEASDALNSLIGSAPLPDEAALHDARTYRDRGWQLIYRRAFTPDPPSPQEEDAFADGVALPLAYERAVGDADTLADRRVDEATLVERAHAAQTVLANAEAEVRGAEARHRDAEAMQATAEAVWKRLCAIFPLAETPTVSEVRGFLKARENAISARHPFMTAEAAFDNLKSFHSAWAQRLAMLVETPEGATLPDLLRAADRKLALAAQAEKTRLALEKGRERAENDLAEAEATHRKAVETLEEWQMEWGRAMTALNRPTDEDPAIMGDVLQDFTDLDARCKDHASLSDRIKGMERDIENFSRDAKALASRVSAELAENDPFAIVMTLRQRLQEERDATARRDEVSQQARHAANQSAIVKRQLEERLDDRHAILEVIGADTLEAAEARLALAAEHAQHAATATEAEGKLAEVGDGHSLENLRREIALASAEEWQARLDDANQRRSEAQAAAQEAAGDVVRLALEMQRAASATGAADAAADQQAAVATMGRTLEEALICHVAADLLEQAITSAAQDAEPEMLRRISEGFSSLTEGAYARVLTETVESNQTRLILVQRDYPNEFQSVKDLSEGTRDQLYLALRLAAIRDYTETPLPFIGDDILQTFDDDRALAALRVLRDLSHFVQVILLTHHRHMLDLANALPAGSVKVQRLGALEELTPSV